MSTLNDAFWHKGQRELLSVSCYSGKFAQFFIMNASEQTSMVTITVNDSYGI